MTKNHYIIKLYIVLHELRATTFLHRYKNKMVLEKF